MLRCTGRYERQARSDGFQAVAGLDEAGRGSLFGAVFAAAVILSPDLPVSGLRDSKQLTPGEREERAVRIRRCAVAWAVAAADAFEIDRINIYQASRLAMRRAVARLDPPADFLLVDALAVEVDLPQLAVIHGDALSQSIAAASILAKVARDECMAAWDAVFPEYGLAEHKGYATPRHLDALARYGPTWLHRHSFEPVRCLSPLERPPRQAELFAALEALP